MFTAVIRKALFTEKEGRTNNTSYTRKASSPVSFTLRIAFCLSTVRHKLWRIRPFETLSTIAVSCRLRTLIRRSCLTQIDGTQSWSPQRLLTDIRSTDSQIVRIVLYGQIISLTLRVTSSEHTPSSRTFERLSVANSFGIVATSIRTLLYALIQVSSVSRTVLVRFSVAFRSWTEVTFILMSKASLPRW